MTSFKNITQDPVQKQEEGSNIQIDLDRLLDMVTSNLSRKIGDAEIQNVILTITNQELTRRNQELENKLREKE